MKLGQIYRQIKEENEPNPESTATSVLLIQRLKTDPQTNNMLRSIYLPTDKFNAIKRFAGLLGIPDERFVDFINQQDNNV